MIDLAYTNSSMLYLVHNLLSYVSPLTLIARRRQYRFLEVSRLSFVNQLGAKWREGFIVKLSGGRYNETKLFHNSRKRFCIGNGYDIYAALFLRVTSPQSHRPNHIVPITSPQSHRFTVKIQPLPPAYLILHSLKY